MTIVRTCACADIVPTARSFAPNAASVAANVTIITVMTAGVATNARAMKGDSAIIAICVPIARQCVRAEVVKTARRSVPDAENAVRNVTSIFVTIAANVQSAQAIKIIALIVIIVRIVCKCVHAEVVKTARKSVPNAENAVQSVTTNIVWNAESVTSAPNCAKIVNHFARTALRSAQLATNARIA